MVLTYFWLVNQENSARLGKFIWKIRKIRKVRSENQEGSFGRLGKFGKFVRKIHTPHQENSSSILGKFRLKKQIPGGKNTFCNCAPSLGQHLCSRKDRPKNNKKFGLWIPHFFFYWPTVAPHCGRVCCASATTLMRPEVAQPYQQLASTSSLLFSAS